MMGAVPQPFDAVDRAYAAELQREPDRRTRWLLQQTAATGPSRRALIGSLGVAAGARVLDVGTGFGCVPLELAAIAAVTAVGVDVDVDVLGAATRIAESAAASGGLVPGSSVRFHAADVLALPFAAASFDVATVRFVYEHIADRDLATDELARVLRPGGLACVVDVDDGLSISDPEPSAAFARVANAFRAAQAARGGDRYVGRTLARLLDAGGFDVTAVLVLPQAAYGPSLPSDPDRALLLERLRLARADMVATGLLDDSELDADLADLAAEVVHGQCQVEAHLAVVGRRRPD